MFHLIFVLGEFCSADLPPHGKEEQNQQSGGLLGHKMGLKMISNEKETCEEHAGNRGI